MIAEVGRGVIQKGIICHVKNLEFILKIKEPSSDLQFRKNAAVWRIVWKMA